MHHAPLGPLVPLFERERAAGNALALGILLDTVGSTYRKPGALMLIAANGDYAGLLSGGCLEGDLGHHARRVIATGEPKLLYYDTRGPEDLLWGIGLGCEGAMRIMLVRLSAEQDWQPLNHLVKAQAKHIGAAAGVCTESHDPAMPVGTVVLPRDDTRDSRFQAVLEEAALSGDVQWVTGSAPDWKVFVLPVSLPPRLLILGAGPDALPLVDFASRLSWKVTLVDHRPAYAQSQRFPAAERVVLASPEDVGEAVDLAGFSAAVVMSHHLPSDLEYLRVLAAVDLPYVGLLGPRKRREKLLSDLGPLGERLQGRLRAPVGLPIGGRSPESIALSVIAEVHAFVHLENSAAATAGRDRRAVPS